MEEQLEKQLSVASCQLPVPTLSPKQGDKGEVPATMARRGRRKQQVPPLARDGLGRDDNSRKMS
jgi:hypothetical protein